MSSNPRGCILRSMRASPEKWISRQRARSQPFSIVASLLPSAGRSEARGPELCVERPDGSQTRIPEDELHRYTSHRWLCNEQAELSKRYSKFNLRGLVDVAVSACAGARYCTKVVKCSEGLREKSFVLSMDNGVEVVAKLPNASAGAAKYTAASEVATHELLRDVFKLPVPRVLAWSYDALKNPVGAEYIITEKAEGVRLSSVWKEWAWKSKLGMVQQIIDLENKLASVRFPSHGSVYFKDELRSLTGKADDLTLDDGAAEETSRFAIGPLTSPELWHGARGDMDMDRGPWRDASDYTRAIGWNEISWIRAHAEPRLNHYRGRDSVETPSNGVSLLTQYMNVAAYLSPPPEDDASGSNVLWHPELTLDNVFVDPHSHQISGIIGWHSARIAPLFYQSGIPPMFQESEGSSITSLSQAKGRKADNATEPETMHRYYEAMVYQRSPRHWAVLSNPTTQALREPIALVTKAWETNNLFNLRQSLISLAERWDELFPESPLPCPIRFTEGEVELHRKEKENMQGMGAILALLRDGGILPADGVADPKNIDVAKRNNQRFKEVFLNSAEDKAERELYTKLWPYQESA